MHFLLWGLKSAIPVDEADKQMAILANELKSPVLSSDSDFFMFDLHHGFIYFNLLRQENLKPLYNICPPPPQNVRALRQLLVQSEAKILIELLGICFIYNTGLVLWLAYCMKTSCPSSKSGSGSAPPLSKVGGQFPSVRITAMKMDFLSTIQAFDFLQQIFLSSCTNFNFGKIYCALHNVCTSGGSPQGGGGQGGSCPPT